MKLRSLLFSLMIVGTLSASALTDSEVIAYIKKQSAAGKTEQQIGKELLAKGVTPEQAKRIKAKYEAEQVPDVSLGALQPSRMRKDSETDTSPDTQLTSGDAQNVRRNDALILEEDTNGELTSANENAAGSGRVIYGHEVFNSKALTFQPKENIATPQNYRLGPGDEVIIDIWGASEDHLRQTISPEGSIMIEKVGPVYLNGRTISEANNHIKSAFAKKYAGVNDAETQVQLTLGQVRSIQVDVMGEVAVPGSFVISPFSTVFHALYRAGGINDIGSLRNIQVLRNGKKIAGVDIYRYLFNGESGGNIKLQEGDVIIVPPYEQLVNVNGNVKRPMYYEIKPDETIQSLLDYAGGFTGDAYSGMVRLARQAGTENELYNVEREEFASYRLKDGDQLTVGTILDRYANKAEVKGAVMRPGIFAISNDLQTVGQLIKKADGLTEDAYTQRAILYREGPELQLEVVSLDLGAILDGSAPDVKLKRNDYLVISSLTDIMDRGTLTIRGEVAEPGEYPFAENMTLEDLILQAGGLLDGASTARVDVARRIVNPSSVTPTEMLSQSFTLSISGNLAKSKDAGFVLRPYDVVEIRKSPGYARQQLVVVRGEALFTGDYAIERRNERLSSIIARAGGLIDGAYVKGAQLTRKLSEEEIRTRDNMLRLASANNQKGQGDSIAISQLNLTDRRNIGIDLEKALANPGSTYDLVVKDGDEIFIPEQQSTVSISGDVLFPNTVVYEPGKKLKYYIEQAGGFGQRARKGSIYVVYMNGKVAKGKGSTVIEPGCSIIVPSKSANSGTDWSKILTFATSFSAVATMAATITNIFK